MNEFEEIFSSRSTDLRKHLDLLEQLQSSAISRTVHGPADTEHINILKSAFLVHLYNVVESVMSKIIDEVAGATKEHSPRSWIDSLFLAWVRHRAALDMETETTKRIDLVVDVIAEAVGRKAIGSTRVARREGNWSHAEIESIAATLACTLSIRDEVKRAACTVYFVDRHAPVSYVRHMRNQVAHGNISFVQAASTLSVDQLRFLFTTIQEYISDVVSSFKEYISGRHFLKADPS